MSKQADIAPQIRVCLLTGAPGVGKTHLIKKAVSGLGGPAGGFYTEEIRTGGARMGFRIVTLDGKTATLSSVNFHSRHRVGKYGVDVESLERVGVAALLEAIQERQVIVIDEIGKMELFSEAFKQAVLQALDCGKKVLGTIMMAPNSFADDIKCRPDVSIVVLTRQNRGGVLVEIRNWLETA